MTGPRAVEIEYEVIESWTDDRTRMELRRYPGVWRMCSLRQTYAGGWYVTNSMSCPIKLPTDSDNEGSEFDGPTPI